MTWIPIALAVLSLIANVSGLCMIAATLDSLVARKQEQDEEPVFVDGNFEIKILPNGMYGLFENGTCVKRSQSSMGIRSAMDEYFTAKRYLVKKVGEKR